MHILTMHFNDKPIDKFIHEIIGRLIEKNSPTLLYGNEIIRLTKSFYCDFKVCLMYLI